ncbi:sugar ABC transporter substrate-binding protein [Nocardia pseudobrasiliensis]|uniref:Ribose transport system substrate-binding protein n=1 Tax=Nocardia pseudobrasiliensis TaxID=45979 RepID=A0A370IB59_9NOCA|nr:substrate-binding domain-containing protein [Nocardia pseudobrasiliensis]RDI67937.1 ribose transport system substrate-binding protein [Nocardia pseudobrasiliensis]
MDVRIRRALLPLVLVGALAAAACGRGGDSGSGEFRIAIVTRNFTNPYWAALRDGALAEGAARGVKVVVQAGQSETDADGENAQISTMAAQGYDCFGVVPVNGTNVITPLAAVARKNIPILNLDTQIDAAASRQAGVSYASFIGSDNLEAGRTAGRTLLEALGGTGKVVVLQGIAGEQNGINRDQGFSETVAGKLDIVQRAPADYEQDKGLQVTEAILKAHPDITGVFAANDTMGLGAAQAIRNAGRTGQIKVISVDGIQAALDAVKAGTLYGTVTQYPYAEGGLAVQGCLALHQGKKLPERVVSPIAFIGHDNVDQQIAAFPRPIVGFDNPLEGLLTK